MSDKLPTLKVHMLGGFFIEYGDIPLSLGGNTTTKATKLLEILIKKGKNGIAREKLMDELFGREEVSDMANNLRVTSHRLKILLADSGLPPYDYIKIEKGVYYWNTPMEMEVDVEKFEELLKQVEQETDIKKKVALATEACRLYGGDFLQNLSGVDWVLMESVRYKNMYTEALTRVCRWLISHAEYEKALAMCSPACEMYPFDEWQSVKIECYIGMKRYKEAMQEYESTAKLLFEELGINPSEQMMKQFEIMSSHMNYKPQELRNIKSRLKEADQGLGAYYCNLPSFRDNYRLVSRIIERNGQSVYLMMCSLTNGHGQPMTNEAKLKVMSEELCEAIRHCLRRGDSFTKYSPSQFLALLVGTDKESCELVFERICKYFCKEHKTWDKYLDFFVSSVAEVDQENSRIRFEEDETIW